MVEVPIGGTIRNTVEWNAIVGGIPTKNFVVQSFYGHNTNDTLIGFDVVGSAPFVFVVTGNATGILTNSDMVVDIDPGLYDCATLIGDGDDMPYPTTYDYRFDNDVLTVVPAIGAEVVNTIFTAV